MPCPSLSSKVMTLCRCIVFDLYCSFCGVAIFQLSTVLTLPGGLNSLSDVWKFPPFCEDKYIRRFRLLELEKCK